MKFFKKQDLIIVAVLLVIAAGLYYYISTTQTNESVVAQIYYKSELVKTVQLDQKVNETFSVPENEHIVFQLTEDGTIAFVESDCPDKVCIHTGKLSHTGQSAACLPNEMLIKIVSSTQHSEEDTDLIIR